jgi:hypothetical protein
MKKIISSLSIIAALISGYAYGAETLSAQDICKNRAEVDEITADSVTQYIEQCVKEIEESAAIEPMATDEKS